MQTEPLKDQPDAQVDPEELLRAMLEITPKDAAEVREQAAKDAAAEHPREQRQRNA